MFRPSVLLVALLFAAPTFWQAAVDQSISLTEALVHFLVALPLAGVLCWFVRAAMSNQQNAKQRDHESR